MLNYAPKITMENNSTLQRHTEKGTIRIASLLKVKQSSKEDCCLFVNKICNREKTRSATAEDGCTPEYILC